MNGKLAKKLRSAARTHEMFEKLPDVDYEVLTENTKTFLDGLGNKQFYSTSRVVMLPSKRKMYKDMKKEYWKARMSRETS